MNFVFVGVVPAPPFFMLKLRVDLIVRVFAVVLITPPTPIA